MTIQQAEWTPDLQETIQKGLNALNNGNAAEAARLFRSVVPQQPRDVDLLHLAAISHLQSDNQTRGRKFLAKALKLAPQHSDANNTLGVLKRHEGRLGESVAAFERAIRSNPNNIKALRNLGQTQYDRNQPEKALSCFEKLTDLVPADSAPHYLMGTTYLSLGNFESAIESFRKTVQIKPETGHAWLHMAELGAVFSDDEINTVHSTLENPELDAEERGKIATALYRVHESRKETDLAGRYLLQGNKLRRGTITYDIEQDEEQMAAAARIVDTGFVSGPAIKAPKDRTPVFILGLPRSGTTLIEQILSNHSQIESAGEVDSVGLSLRLLTQSSRSEYPHNLRHLKSGQLARLAANTVRTMAEAVSGDAPIIVDKTPTNFLYLGLIKRLWPEARIIHCRRELVDCAWSNFRLQFASGNDYAYEQAEMVRYFRAKERLMDHWREVCPDGFLDLHYEEMVADQEGQTRRLLDYCGLPWEDACLNFHNNPNSVRTASSAQVRSPIYKTSLKAWEPYREILQPMIEGLGGN